MDLEPTAHLPYRRQDKDELVVKTKLYNQQVKERNSKKIELLEEKKSARRRTAFLRKELIKMETVASRQKEMMGTVTDRERLTKELDKKAQATKEAKREFFTSIDIGGEQLKSATEHYKKEKRDFRQLSKEMEKAKGKFKKITRAIQKENSRGTEKTRDYDNER